MTSDTPQQSQHGGEGSQNIQAGRDVHMHVNSPKDDNGEEPVIQKANLADVEKYCPKHKRLMQAIRKSTWHYNTSLTIGIAIVIAIVLTILIAVK